MTSILRPSSTLARISKSSLQSAARSTLYASNHAPLRSRICIQQARTYASEKKPQPSKKDDAKKDRVSGNTAVEPPSKPAPGTENLYDRRSNTPLSPGTEDGPSETPLAEGMTKLNVEDEKAMMELLDTLKKSLPKAQVEVIERAFEAIKKEGIPGQTNDACDGGKTYQINVADGEETSRAGGWWTEDGFPVR
jgi:AFG3 family protein